MKAILTALIILTIGLSVMAADEVVDISYGSGGRTFTVTTSATRIDFDPPARTVAIYNAGTTGQVVFVSENVTTGEFATIIAATNGLPIRGGAAETLTGGEGDGGFKKAFILLQAASGSMLVDVAAQK